MDSPISTRITGTAPDCAAPRPAKKNRRKPRRAREGGDGGIKSLSGDGKKKSSSISQIKRINYNFAGVN